MSLKRLVIDGYGQLELNNVAFRRDGRIEAQCKLDETDFKSVPAENGMLLAVDNVKRVVRFPKSDEKMPLALHYSTEHMYDERLPGLKNFKLEKGSFLPRMGYLAEGDKFTTNCICYDDSDFSTEDLLVTALEKVKETPLYAAPSTIGAWQITKTDTNARAIVLCKTTMPDGQLAVKLQALK